MFDLQRKETFKEKVTVNVKTDSGWREEHFIGIFKRVDTKRHTELQNVNVNDVVDEVLVGWEMKDLQRNDVPFNEENLAALKAQAGASWAVATAFLKANVGAKEKN